MTQTANPLKQFFRQPAIYMRLPSGGQFWPPGSLEIPPNGEVAVYPMTALDEISYRTPDALFNGAATISVIESCIPAIKDGWKIPSVDLNSVLVAIRIASFGDKMELKSQCPQCETENEFELDLNVVMSTVNPGDYSEALQHGDIQIFFKPIGYDAQNKINLMQFEQQKMMQMITDSDLPEEEKTKKFNETLKAITQITVVAIQSSIGVIRTPQAMVTEPEFIAEFLSNCDRALFTKIKDKVIEIQEYLREGFRPESVSVKLNVPIVITSMIKALHWTCQIFSIPALEP